MRLEVIVFGLIAVFVLVGTFTLQVPVTNSSLMVMGQAAEISEGRWINSEPLELAELRGKVVLIDFWTYSCINCIRTLPHLTGWHEKYAGKGLVIIGVHTPEFEFEKDYNNVVDAAKQFGIEYPIVQDNDFKTWRAYGNNYWPRKYLIDKDGSIRYDHIGEGAYQETEQAIIELLKETGVNLEDAEKPNVDRPQSGTPELYLGYSFARAPLGNEEGFSPGNVVDYKSVNITQPNIVYLSGKWKNGPESSTAVENSRLFLVYSARKVNIVAGGTASIQIFVDGKFEKTLQINEQKLYNIVSRPDFDSHLVEIAAEPGFELYTFTFG